MLICAYTDTVGARENLGFAIGQNVGIVRKNKKRA